MSVHSRLRLFALVGQYFVSTFGNFSYHNFQSESPAIQFSTDRYQNSELLLSFAADQLFHVVKISGGVIVNVTVDEFEGLSRDGKLTATVKSTGNVTSEFGVTVECSASIAPVQAKIIALAPHQIHPVDFILEAESTQDGQLVCEVELKNAIGDTLATYGAYRSIEASFHTGQPFSSVARWFPFLSVSLPHLPFSHRTVLQWSSTSRNVNGTEERKAVYRMDPQETPSSAMEITIRFPVPTAVRIFTLSYASS